MSGPPPGNVHCRGPGWLYHLPPPPRESSDLWRGFGRHEWGNFQRPRPGLAASNQHFSWLMPTAHSPGSPCVPSGRAP